MNATEAALKADEYNTKIADIEYPAIAAIIDAIAKAGGKEILYPDFNIITRKRLKEDGYSISESKSKSGDTCWEIKWK